MLSLKELEYILFCLVWHEKSSLAVENIKVIPFLAIALCHLFFFSWLFPRYWP